MLPRRFKYLIRSLSNGFQEKACPFCGSKELIRIDQKYFITTLFKCAQCQLNHRHPKDDSKYLDQFYQSEYQIDTHMMTDLPSDDEIDRLKEEGFKDLRIYDKYIQLLFGSKMIDLVDYGCSWGYNVFKLCRSGYNAIGYEVSAPRASFGEQKLGVSIYSDLNAVPKNQDLLLSSHVIEHLSDISSFISFSQSCLKKEGLFMAFCPNGNDAYRKRDPITWHGSWGDLHLNLLDVAFAKHAFKDHPYLILTGDWAFDLEEINQWDGKCQQVGTQQDGKELLIIAKPNVQI